MGLTEEQLQKIRDAINASVRPILIFDDDPDGLSSFLLIYKHIKEGRGMPVKNTKTISPETARKINEYDADLVIILDIPMVSQDFLDIVKTPVIWIDHHPLQNMKGVQYYNPRMNDPKDNRPTSYWVYRVVQENLWIAMAGMVGDWFMPEDAIRKKFVNEYPGLLPEDVLRPEVALHNSKLGELVQVFSFNLKGKGVEVMKSIKVLTRMEEPSEILEQKTAGGKFVYKKYLKLKEKYDQLLKMVVVNPDDKLVLFTYANENGSFSAELSNELIYRHPDKVILVAWEYNGEYKCSLRSTDVNLPNMIDKAIEGISGYGGGHDHAAGACVKTEHFEEFVKNFRAQLKQ